MAIRHDDRCPTCGKFVEAPESDPDGFYDLPPGGDPLDYIVVYCSESCANRKFPPCTYEDGTTCGREAL